MTDLASTTAESEKTKIVLINAIEQNSYQAYDWAQKKGDGISKNGTKDLYVSFSLAPRFVGKSQVELKNELESDFRKIYGGVFPVGWTLDELVRVYLLLCYPLKESTEFKKVVNQLFQTADVHEQVILYKSLLLLPLSEIFVDRASEGVRSNMGVVFDAISLNNPYPSKYFDENAWNQMVLKAIFTGKPLNQIVGLDQRRNPELARMASDFAHERWAAKREVSPELWRLIAPFINEVYIKDIQKLVESGSEAEKAAAVLVCSESKNTDAKGLLDKAPELVKKVNAKEITWNTF